MGRKPNTGAVMIAEPFFARTSSRLADLVSQMLEPHEREVVQGDLLEGGESAWQSLVGILGLVIRREAALWKNWRPWLAAFGLALPSSFLLMGFSISVSRAYQQLVGVPLLHATGVAVRPGFTLFLCNVLLLAAWSWTGGFVVGSVSRRTVWVSAALSFAPCVFCLERFRVESLSRLCLLLFFAWRRTSSARSSPSGRAARSTTSSSCCSTRRTAGTPANPTDKNLAFYQPMGTR